MTKLGFIVMCLCGGALGLVFLAFVKAIILPVIFPPVIPELTAITTKPGTTSPVTPKKVIVNSKSLASAVSKSLEGSKGTYAVVVKNLRSGEEFALNENQQFQTASLYKLWVMATATKMLEDGSMKDDEVLSDSIAQLNLDFAIASESAELTSGSISLRPRPAIEQMITISHNYAAMLLSKRVKLSNVTTFLTTHSYTQSALGDPPVTTAADIAQFFEDLYQGKLGNEESTQAMVAMLKRQELNNKLPLYLPKNTIIAHKTGELDSYTHDAGIVFSNKGDYLIVVLSESSFPPGAEERIGQVSKAVFDYFAAK